LVLMTEGWGPTWPIENEIFLRWKSHNFLK
jgi:hypothetical protein